MNDNEIAAGLSQEDIDAVADVWNSTQSDLLGLIEAGQLDPKKDFRYGDFRGWPLAGQDVRGIDFTGSDLRGTGISRAILDRTTILVGATLDAPSSQRNPRQLTQQSNLRKDATWPYHWHAGVQRAYGQKLYVIFVRFIAGSIIAKDSIVQDLIESGASDFLILNLFSQWDVLIRVWADTSTIEKLKERLAKNTEISRLHRRDPVEIKELFHFPDKGRYRSISQVQQALHEFDTSKLKDIQKNGRRSEHFQAAHSSGLIIDNETRFVSNRIQFYILVNCARDVPDDLRESLADIVEKLKSIKSKSIYFPSNGRILAIVKGQTLPNKYYDIHEFLSSLTERFEKLLRLHIETETMLVANEYKVSSSAIDFDYARRDLSLSQPTAATRLIERGENDAIEFKSTLRTNLRTGERDARMDFEVLKTIAAFLNSRGGKLIIGVSDNGDPVGLEADKFESEDKADRHLASLIRDKIGSEHIDFIHYRFEDFLGKRVIVVECERGRSPVYVKDGNQDRFFMRTGAATTELSGRRLTDYVTLHFR